MAENKGFSLKTFGMPWWLAGAIAVIVIAAAATGALSADLAGCFALMLAIGLICNEIGERIPFWLWTESFWFVPLQVIFRLFSEDS